MKKVKTNKLGRRILSIVLTAALVVGLMPGNMLTVSAEGTDTVISDELIVESVSSNDATSTTECTCETDDPAFHATNCPAYIAPENPQCYCAEKCTEDTLNIWCDVCGVQGVSACQGEDTAMTMADSVSYIERTWDGTKVVNTTKTITEYTSITSSTTSMSEGWYVLDTDVNISDRINVSGEVHLVLKDGYTLTVPKGINTGAGKFYVHGQENDTGKIVAIATKSTNYNAMIGEDYQSGNPVNIEIDGGAFEITWGSGAGIGGAYNGAGGTIVINGGNIVLKGATYYCGGAGIGGNSNNSATTVTVNGGSIQTDGGIESKSALIGAGYSSNVEGNTVTINGGEIDVSNTGDGAAIGAGQYGSCSININAGMITAQGYSGAGIGKGSRTSYTCPCPINISGGTINATSDYGAGIGGGNGYANDTINISGGTINATSTYGAGIGGGRKADNGTIILSGGTINANSTDGTAIGGGYDCDGYGKKIVDSQGNEVCLYEIELIDLEEDVVVNSITYDTSSYGCTDVWTRDGKLYCYLLKTLDTSKVKINVGGVIYSFLKYDEENSIYLYTGHTHEWIFSLGKTDESSDVYDKIVAECRVAGCAKTEATFSIPENRVYTGSPIELVVVSEIPEEEIAITYTAMEGSLTDGKPVNVGTYKAVASLTGADGQTVSTSDFIYEITKQQYADISGVCESVDSAAKVNEACTSIDETEYYSGTIEWSVAPVNNELDPSQDYTATITLNAKLNYKFGNVSYDGWTVESNDGLIVVLKKIYYAFDFEVSAAGNESVVLGTDYVYDRNTKTLTIVTNKPIIIKNVNLSEETDNHIVVGTGSNANITLAGVNIKGEQPILVKDDSGNVTITLKDETTNTLMATKGAGLEKQGQNSTLILQCEHASDNNHMCGENCGTLVATGAEFGAGIGGCGREYAGREAVIQDKAIAYNITIKGGNITANGGENGAGIGSGGGNQVITNFDIWGYNAKNIIIQGGIIEARGGCYGAGIGSGGLRIYNSEIPVDLENKRCEDIKITGAVVTAIGGDGGAGIGSGRVLHGSGETNGFTNAVTGIIVEDCSLKVSAGSNAHAIGDGSSEDFGGKFEATYATIPTNKGGSEVYPYCIANPDDEAVYIDGNAYVINNHAAVDGNDTNLYVYLTANTWNAPHTIKVGSDGTEEKYYYRTSALEKLPIGMYKVPDNPATPTISGSSEYGAKQLSGYHLDGWTWITASKYPQIDGTDNMAYYNADYNTYDYSGITGYNSSTNRVERHIPITITQKPITITADNKTIVYGDEEVALTYTISDGTPLVGEDTLSGSITRVDGSDVGTYAITQGTLANANYAITFHNGTYTITKANAKLNFAEDTKTLCYDGAVVTSNELPDVAVTNENDKVINATVKYGYRVNGSTGEFTSGLPTNVGTYEVKAEIEGTTNYNAASDTMVLTIEKRELADCDISDIEAVTYDGTAHKPAVTVKIGNVTLNAGDYTIDYTDNINVGTATITITGKNNCTGSVTKTFVINPKTVTPTIEISDESYDYTAEAVEPEVTLKDGATVIPASEYGVAYTGNTDAGTATITVTDLEGGNYTFEAVSKEFTISTMTPTITWNDQTLASTGAEADITAPTITFAGTDKPEVELTYSYKAQGDAEYTTGLPTACGIYDVKVNVSATDNYNAVEDTMTLTITCTDADNNGICDHCGMYEAPESVDGYYQIANAGNLMWFAQKVNEGQTAINAKLTADIDMKDIDWTMMSSFAGTFDGNGYTISGLNGHKAYTANTHGFISTLADDGVVKNLTFTEADIWNHEGSGAISAVIVYTNNGTVENCVVKNSLIQHGNYDALGVVVGVNGGTIRNCASISNTMKRRHEGVNNKAACGFVWSNGSDATIENCMVYDCTYTDASANYAFTGINNGTITNCYYYESSETISDTVATDKTVDQFASGEVAYLLNDEKTDGTQSWYQTLKTDTYPVPDNTQGTVYYGYANCQTQDKIYANTELSKDKPEHSWKCELDEANTNKMTFSCTTDGCEKGGTITVTGPKDATYNGSNHSATVTVETEENEELIETPVITYTSLTEGVELVDGKPVNAGTYKASITLGEVTAYDEFEIAKATPDIGTVSAENMENTLDISKVELSRTDDTISGTLSLKEGTELAYGTKDYTYVFKSGDANYSDVEGTVSITISDTIAPTATYQIGTNGFKAFMNAITFGFFFKDTQTVEIQYTDDTTDENGNITKGSGIKTKQYYIASSVVANDAVGSISWTDYTKSISLDKNGKYFVYTKVVDNAGNTVILNSDGIVIYEDSVVTTDSADYTYKSNKDITFEMDAKGNTFATLKDSEGNEVDEEYYTVTDNSKVTFKAAYLDTLTVASKPYTYKIYMNPQGVETNKTELSYEISINVLAKELTVTGATATERTYEKGNTSVAITVVALEGVANSDAVSVDVTGLKGTLSGANAGDYTEVTLPALKLTGKDKDNYVLTQPSKAVPTNVTISPQATGTAQNVTKKYLFSQENADTINLVSLLPKDCGTVVSYGTPVVDGNVTYKVAPSIEEGTLAYTVADGSEEIVGNKGTITIDVKTQNYTSVPITISVALVDQIPVMQQTEVTLKDESQKLTYGQKLSVLELTEVVFKGTDGETVTGTLQWKNGDSIPTVDTKKASWEFVPSASYNDKYATAEGELTISVVPATPEVDTLPTVNAITYHPDTKLADIALSGGKMNGIAGELTGTWAWKDATICPKAGDNTYVAVFTPEDSTNYKTKEVDITVSVAKATPYIKSAVVAEAVTYGEALKDSALSGGAVQYSETDETAVAGSWSWKEVTTKPVVADSNVTQYDVVFTPTDAENYNKVETKITLTVNKAETTPNLPESTMSALYSQKTVGALELPEGWVWDEADSAKELTVDVAVEATAIYNGADKGNYVTESVTISITRQACDHEESDILYTGEGEKAPTCTVDGIGHTECTKCKEPMQTNVTVEASGHTGGTATCKNKAECSVCHEGYGELDKNNHAGETEVKDAKKATCAVDGYTGDTYCKDCGAKIATGTKIDKSTAHTWDNGVVTKEATATEKGEKTYTCSVCKTTKKEEIPTLGAPKVGEEIASEDGSATYKVTEAGENGNSVTYEAPTDKNQATVVVPATVTINNITYNVTTISDTAFAGNKKLTSVTIGDNVTGFSDKTFKGCSNLKTLIIGNGVTSIPANAFKNFKNLTTVKMGTGVKTIGKNAFYGCKKLKNLTLGKNVVTIGDKAFYKCTSLTKLTIPSKVKTIGKSAFYGCKALKTITIGKSVTKIGSKAFYGCSKTKTLTIKSSKLTTKKIGSKAFTKTPKSMTVKVPKKKFKAYKSMFIKRGVNKKAKFRKS